MSTSRPKPMERFKGMTLKASYTLERMIGRGGMGAVFEARQLAVDRMVAVKLLRSRRAADPATVKRMEERFRREAKALARLQNPHTLQLIDFGTTDEGMLFLVLELLRGAELSKLMEKGPMDPERVAEIGRQICISLGEAHEQGLVHRDLKPDNIFVTQVHGDDHVKVMDFGIARLVGEGQDSRITKTGAIVGTPKYIAPEQASDNQASPQSDLYSLGVMLYQMLAGRPLFDGDSAMEIVMQHVHTAPPPLDPGLQPEWQLLLDRLLAKKPEHRPGSALAVAARLGELKAAESGLVKHASGALPKPVETFEGQMSTTSAGRGNASRYAVLVALLLVVAGAIGGVVALTGDPEPTQLKAVVPQETEIDKAPASREKPPAEAAKRDAPRPAAAEPERRAAATKKQVAAPTTVIVKTTPAGAVVIRHSRVLCETPCETKLAAGGETVLEVVLPGYKSRLLAVPLVAGSVMDRELVLEPLVAPAPAPVHSGGAAVSPAGAGSPAGSSAATAAKKPKPNAKKKRKKKRKKGGYDPYQPVR